MTAVMERSVELASTRGRRRTDVLGDGDDVGSSNFGDGNLFGVGSVQVDVVRSDTGSWTRGQSISRWRCTGEERGD